MNGRISAFLLGLSFAAVYVLGCATARMIEPRASAQEAPPGVTRWEYVRVRREWDEGNWVAEAGMEGWELAWRDGPYWYFKRPL